MGRNNCRSWFHRGWVRMSVHEPSVPQKLSYHACFAGVLFLWDSNLLIRQRGHNVEPVTDNCSWVELSGRQLVDCSYRSCTRLYTRTARASCCKAAMRPVSYLSCEWYMCERETIRSFRGHMGWRGCRASSQQNPFSSPFASHWCIFIPVCRSNHFNAFSSLE